MLECEKVGMLRAGNSIESKQMTKLPSEIHNRWESGIAVGKKRQREN
jgi:hypothetical protein